MVRFYVKFTVEAPIYPEGYGTDDSMTLTSITGQFKEMAEKYGFEVYHGPHIENPNIVRDSNGNHKVKLGRLKASCRCSVSEFIEFYKAENDYTFEDGRLAPFVVNLTAKPIF